MSHGFSCALNYSNLTHRLTALSQSTRPQSGPINAKPQAVPMRILVIEDDAIARRVLELFLKPYGTIETAKNGDEGFAKFTEAHQSGDTYDLLCLDINIPGKAGLEVLSEVREFESVRSAPRAVSAIMLTGSADEGQIAKAKELGAIGYLLKPVLESDLVALLGKLGIEPV